VTHSKACRRCLRVNKVSEIELALEIGAKGEVSLIVGSAEMEGKAGAVPANGIAMGAAGNERHIMPRRRHSPPKYPPTAPAAITAIRI
jgi:hypothetical protein